jgi:hypothetical protein
MEWRFLWNPGDLAKIMNYVLNYSLAFVLPLHGTVYGNWDFHLLGKLVVWDVIDGWDCG